MTTLLKKPTRKISPRRSFRGSSWTPLSAKMRVEDWAKVLARETKPPYELMDGILKQKMPTKRQHSFAANLFVFLLMSWGFEKGWRFFTEGTGYMATEFDGYVPDVAGFAPGYEFDPKAVYETGAFLIAEIWSRSTGKEDRTKKLRGYQKAGIPIYILIHPEKKTFEVFRLQNGKYATPEILRKNEVWQPAELPGLKLELAQLWMS